VGHPVAGWVSPTASPFLAVGGTAIDREPLPIGHGFPVLDDLPVLYVRVRDQAE
jgi:hypothetical protein